MLIPRRDLDFHVYEVLDAAGLCERPRFRHHDRQVFDGVLDSAYRIAEERFLPFAARADVEEPKLENGVVHLLPETKNALSTLAGAGFFAVAFDEAQGGMQLPYLLSQAGSAVFDSANVAFHSYVMLTKGAAHLILRFGDVTQARLFASPMLEGRYFGTMCLSEPGAGSSLADIKTLASPRDDGTYLISGTKMWISGGEHELAENIVHLVLARTPGSPPGVKGISLFVVPRYRVGNDGSTGADNDVRLAGLNHKMGWRGTVNTVLNFGERGDCQGLLLGPLHRGLDSMFQMMNEARIAVGVCSVALAYAGYRYSLGYARERLQGRPVGAKDPSGPQVPIIEHADVRRMLLAQKAAVEGGLALVLYCARLVDDIRSLEDPSLRQRCELLLDLLTPIAKSWPSEHCLEANKLAIQVLGGYGYTRDYPVERLYRDNRLNHIHEGAYGIQGLDLLGRKVRQHHGAALRELAERMRACIDIARRDPALAGWADSLAAVMADIEETTRVLLAAAATGRIELALANATLYLDAVGHAVVAWRWLEQALVAQRALGDATEDEREFYRGKLAACRYFFRYELPHTGPTLALLRSLDDTTTTMDASAF